MSRKIMKGDGTAISIGDGHIAQHMSLGTLISGEDQTNDVLVVEQGQFGYEVVPVTTQTTLGATGATGDFLHRILVPNGTTAVTIHDGAVLFYVWTITAATEPNVIEINAVCATSWKLTCIGAGATAVGRFT